MTRTIVLSRKAFMLIGGCILALCNTHSARAQQTALNSVAHPGPQNEMEEVTITGSRLRGEAPVGSTVVSLGRAEIEQSGAVTLDRTIKEIPQVFDLGVSENSRGQAGGSGNIVYGNTINLRGIGPYATLVLIDGHRVVNNSRSTDPSVLPSLGVERVEVVADGASAIYGSEAVAGVVNLVPRRSLDGGEAFSHYGVTPDGAFNELALGAAFGKVFANGQFMLAYEHVHRSSLSGDDRTFFRNDQTAFGGNDYRVTRCAPGTIKAGGKTYAIPAGGVTQATSSSLVAGTSNKCDELTNQDLIPKQIYNSLNSTGTLDITDDISVFFDGFYSKRDFYHKSPFTTATVTVPQTNAFFVRPAGFTGTSYTIDYNFKNELPANDSFGFGESWQITPGVRVKLPYDWEVEALADFGETKDFSYQYYGLNNAALNTALASSNPATAFDPYGLGRTPSSLVSQLANQIFLAPTNGALSAYELRLNGPLYSLPGGDVKLAAGYERQDFTVKLGSARGAPTTPIAWRTFGRIVDSGYAELLIPIFGAGNAVAGFQSLDVDAAVRYDSYSDVGSTTNPKFGVNWTPMDGLKLRGSYGTSFRAPTIPEIYGNSNALFGQSYQNPAGGAPLQGYALSGPNLDLKPETAETWSVGADFDMIENLSVGLTYFEVKYENQVSANLSDLAILTRESQYAGTGIILRGSDAAARVQQLLAQGVGLAGGSFPGGNPANVTLFVDGRSQNLGISNTHGIDFTVNYTLPIGADKLVFDASGMYLTKYSVAVTPAAPVLDQLNLIFRPLQFKGRTSVGWEHGPLTLRALVSLVGSYTNSAVTPNQSVGSYTPVDLFATYQFGDVNSSDFIESGAQLGIEVRNVFDEDPPYVNIAPSVNGSGGYDATASNPVGRLLGITLRKKF